MPIAVGVIDLDAVTRAAGCFAPLPASSTRLATLVAHDSPDLAQIVEIVRYDQALTAALLRRANSSWSAARTEITTVRDAVVRLGAGPVVALALGVNVRARLSGAIPSYGLAEGELWDHAVAATLAAEALMRVTERRLPAETPTAALLHDVGKLVMARFVDADDLARIDAALDRGATRMQAETDILGIDHAQLGGQIARAWELPESLIAGIAGHHAPGDHGDAGDGGDGIGLIGCGVHLADVVAKAVGAGPDDNAELEQFARAMGELGISADAYDDVCRFVAERFTEVAGRFA